MGPTCHRHQLAAKAGELLLLQAHFLSSSRRCWKEVLVPEGREGKMLDRVLAQQPQGFEYIDSSLLPHDLLLRYGVTFFPVILFRGNKRCQKTLHTQEETPLKVYITVPLKLGYLWVASSSKGYLNLQHNLPNKKMLSETSLVHGKASESVSCSVMSHSLWPHGL